MPPDSQTIMTMVALLRRSLQRGKVVGGTNIAQCHLQEFVLRVAIGLDRGVVHFEETQTFAVKDPHGMWVGGEHKALRPLGFTAPPLFVCESDAQIANVSPLGQQGREQSNDRSAHQEIESKMNNRHPKPVW